MQSCKNTFLSLVRLGIGHSSNALSQPINWQETHNLAEKQGLCAVVLDGVEQLPATVRPPQEFLLEWIGEVLHGYDYIYKHYCKAISELADFYNSHGYKMMVLKGYACSLDWTKPSHRPCGDIDIWLFGKQKEADATITKEKGIKIDKSHHHHTVFNWDDFIVENHYDFVNVHAHRSSAELEEVFKELGKDDTHFVEVKSTSTDSSTKIYLPSPNLHALFLIKHMVSHFAAAEINLRQVLDWAFFVEKNTKEIDWKWLDGMLVKYSMKGFIKCINGICVEDLGFDAGIFHEAQFLSALKDRILIDILNPEYTSAEPKGFVRRFIYKYKRWQGNAWKQRLCYKESRWEYFWTGIWAKLMKPASI
jgi:hypothetical protein